MEWLSVQDLEECLKGINYRIDTMRLLLELKESKFRREALERAEKVQSKLNQFFEDLKHEQYIRIAKKREPNS